MKTQIYENTKAWSVGEVDGVVEIYCEGRLFWKGKGQYVTVTKDRVAVDGSVIQ